jgi:hypothetical protein
MKQIHFSVLFIIAAILASIHSAAGQATNATMQSGSSRVVASRAAPVAKPTVNTAVAPHVVPRPASFSSRTISPYAPRIIGQPGTSLRTNYSPVVRTLNPRFVALRTQQTAPVGEQPITLDPTTRERELRTLTAMRERRGLGTQQPNTLDPATRERRSLRNKNATLATLNTERQVTTHDPAARPQVEPRESPRDAKTTKKWRKKDNHLGYRDACRRHWREWHDRNWWHNNCNTIVFVTSGYYFLDGSYWYPAWGYNPLQTYYDYDGPIYTYGNLLPDEVIANVQVALQDTGYYSGPITGSLDVELRAAMANFQRDYGLPITGAIDEPTVETLGLYQTDSQFVTP